MKAVLPLLTSITILGCGSPPPPEEPGIVEKKTAAEVSYGGQLLKCVDEAPTPKAADECAARVRAEWAKKDAGQ